MYVPAKNSASSELYPWQVEALDRALRGNVIVMIPTGGGKTLIAVKVIDHYRALVPAKKAIFVVPTRPLVRQQAEYCEIHCATGLRAAQISGMLDWDINEWQTCIRTHDILVGTAQIFKDALLSRKLLVPPFHDSTLPAVSRNLPPAPSRSLARPPFFPPMFSPSITTAVSYAHIPCFRIHRPPLCRSANSALIASALVAMLFCRFPSARCSYLTSVTMRSEIVQW